jgi:ferredoxin
VPECPVEAIFHQDNVPDEGKDFNAVNTEMAPQCPVLTEKKEHLAGKE